MPGDHLAVARRRAPAPSSRTAPSSPRSSRPGRRRGSSRSGRRASGARAANARCAPERSSGSWVGTLPVAEGAVDSGGGLRAGFHWAAVDSFRVQRKPPPEGGYLFVLSADIGRAGGFRGRVASQKIGAVASELARSAPQHTILARKDPYNQQVSVRCSPLASCGWRAKATKNRSPDLVPCRSRRRAILQRKNFSHGSPEK